MADRWNEERERMWRDRRADRPDREDYGASDYERRDYALGDYDAGYRSFQPRDRDYGRDRGPVFGERETGGDYTGPRYGAGGYTGYLGERDGGRRHAAQEFSPPLDRDDRRYDDAGGRDVYGGGFSSAPSGPRGYDSYRGSRFGAERGERAYRQAYGPDRQDRDRDDRDGRSFWDRATERVASWFGEYDDDGRERDARHAGHRGRGPQGYKRSDERINDEAHERLTDDAWLDASNISLSVSGGEVTLSGTVTEREAKHRAERIIENLSGVTHVQNNLRVERGNYLTRSGSGFGDSAHEAQMRDRSSGSSANSAGDGDLTLTSSGKGTGASRTQ